MYLWIHVQDDLVAIRLVVPHENRLQSDPARGGQSLVEGAEVLGPPTFADCFDHLHTDDGIELAGHVAVVLDPDVDVRGQACDFDSAVEPGPPVPRTRSRSSPGPRVAPPAGPIAPQPVPISSTREPRPTPVASSSRSILRCLCRGQRLGLRIEQRRRIGHRLVQEGGEAVRLRGRSGARCCGVTLRGRSPHHADADSRRAGGPTGSSAGSSVSILRAMASSTSTMLGASQSPAM